MKSKLIIQTQRLLLKEITLNDAAFFLELVNTPGWLKFIGDRNVHSITDAEKYLQEKIIPSYTEYGFGFYKMVVKEEASVIGICGLIKRPTLEHVDIGYAILPKYERKGYTYEAAEAVMEYAQSTLGLKIILGIVSKENEGSKRVLEKIGLTCTVTAAYEADKDNLLYSSAV